MAQTPYATVSTYELPPSLTLFAAATVGGLTTIRGAVIGGAFLAGVPYVTTRYHMSLDKNIIFGLALIAAVTLFPDGIGEMFGGRIRQRLRKRMPRRLHGARGPRAARRRRAGPSQTHARGLTRLPRSLITLLRMTSAQAPTVSQPHAPHASPGAATVAAVALLGCGVIHAVAAYAHRNTPPSHVVFFVAIALAQALLALRCALSWRRADRLLVAVLSLGVTAVWLVSRTWGLPSSGKEPVEMGDAIASALQIVTATVALIGLAATATATSMAMATPGRSSGEPQAGPTTNRPRSKAGVAAIVAIGAGLTAFAVPAVAGHSYDSNPLAVGSISAV